MFMKAKELAELLLQHPDFEIEGILSDTSKCTSDCPFPNYSTFAITGIADVGYSDKVIVFRCEKRSDDVNVEIRRREVE